MWEDKLTVIYPTQIEKLKKNRNQILAIKNILNLKDPKNAEEKKKI